MYYVKYCGPILIMLSHQDVILRSNFIAETNQISTCLCRDIIQCHVGLPLTSSPVKTPTNRWFW